MEWDDQLAVTSRPYEIVRHPKPPKSFKEMTGPEFVEWDNTNGFAAATRGSGSEAVRTKRARKKARRRPL
jgi:hypothetical protein